MAFHRCFLCRYAALKVVSVHDWKLATTFWGSILLSFIVTVYLMVAEKQYQINEDAIASISVKVKGRASLLDKRINGKPYMLDYVDLVDNIDSNTIFIETAFSESINPLGNPSDLKMINKKINGGIQRINSTELKNLTLYFRQDLVYPTFNYSTTTRKKIFGFKKQKNYFTLNEILERAGFYKDKSDHQIWEKGAIIKVNSNRQCNLDNSNDICKDPHIKIDRLDSGDGYNCRIITLQDNKIRKIRKRYGIKIIFSASGVAGKFDIFSLFVSIGAALAYLALIRLMTDLVLMYCVQHREKYYDAKYDHYYNDDDKWILGNMPDNSGAKAPELPEMVIV